MKRKPETTISTESMTGARKREKPAEQIKATQSKLSISEVMDVDEQLENEQTQKNIAELSSTTLPDVVAEKTEEITTKRPTSKAKAHADTIIEEIPTNVLQKPVADEPKSTKNFAKTKSIDSSEALQSTSERIPASTESNITKPSTERRKSRILEAAEKFEPSNAVTTADKSKKYGAKKENDKKSSTAQSSSSVKPISEKSKKESENRTYPKSESKEEVSSGNSSGRDIDLTKSDSKNSNLSLDEARRSMENSIALLNQAKMESNTELDQLCAKTENVAVSGEQDDDRQKKLKYAREIIGNAIPRLSGMGR